MIDDISNSIKAELYGRTASPLFGAFFLSWSVWNWKFWLVVFSGLEIVEKITFIDGQLYSGFWQPVFFLFLGPLSTALLYIYAYPIPARFVYRHSGQQQKELRKIKVEIEDETPLSQDEHNRLRQKVSNLESAYYADLANKDSEIERLRALIEQSNIVHVVDNEDREEDLPEYKDSQNQESFSLSDTEQPVITDIEVGGSSYVLGVDFKKSNPGESNIIKLKDHFNYQDSFQVKFKTNKPLIDGQYYRLFDGHSQHKSDVPDFTIHKTDYENKNAFVCVMQPNPSRKGKDMVISNKVQFSY